jgi:hypothetical protein
LIQTIQIVQTALRKKRTMEAEPSKSIPFNVATLKDFFRFRFSNYISGFATLCSFRFNWNLSLANVIVALISGTVPSTATGGDGPRAAAATTTTWPPPSQKRTTKARRSRK